MSWKAHWCEAALKFAAEKGWRVGEIEGGRLAFEIADGHVEPIDFTEAQQKAAMADGYASDAIMNAAEKMLAHIETPILKE